MARYREDNGSQQEQEYRPRRFRDDDEPAAEAPAAPPAKKQEPELKRQAPEKPAPQKQPERIPEPTPPKENKPKKKRKSTPILIILLIVAILVFMGSAAMLIWEMVIQPSMTDSANEEIRAVATETVSSGTEEAGRATVDFTSLREVNTDIVGWINIPNTIVDLPVLQSSKDDPEYYLYRNYKKEDTKYGSIFLDSANSITPGDRYSKSQTLYGHHMDDGRMFADILKYSDLDFYKSAPVLYYDTYLEQGDWKVISVFKTNVLESQGKIFQYVRPSFGGDEDFLNFVHNVMIRSMIDTGVTVNENDQLLVLSTCSYEYENFRTVVVARKVRPGEKAEVDTSKAVYRNEKTLYPDCWYWSGDGAAPVYPASFAEALKEGQAGWYDGGYKVR